LAIVELAKIDANTHHLFSAACADDTLKPGASPPPWDEPHPKVNEAA
jgi:hypothetical protein